MGNTPHVVANSPAHSDNQLVPNSQEDNASTKDGRPQRLPFEPGTMVVTTLGNPREKFWGVILVLSPTGLSLCGVELASFDDLVSLIQQNEPFSPAVVFFPMHRIERVELDLPDGNIPSLSQRFANKTKLDAAVVLTKHSQLTPAELASSSEDGQ
jgi:hypothetical protein